MLITGMTKIIVPQKSMSALGRGGRTRGGDAGVDAREKVAATSVRGGDDWGEPEAAAD